MLLALRCFATLLHAALIFGLAPLLTGVLDALRARLLGLRGPPLLQPYRDLFKLIQKTVLIPDTATELYKIWPFAAFGAVAAAALLVPGFCLNLATASSSDFITLIGLFALARAATMLAGLETGFSFGGAGVARKTLFSIFSEAALLMAVLILALIASNPTVDGIAASFRFGQADISFSLGFALAAILAVALVENGSQSAQHELGMVHEALRLEYSGRYLALFHYIASLRLLTWFSLIGTVFLPYGMAQPGNPLTWPLGMLAWLIKLSTFAVILALFDVSRAKMRIFRVPEFLGAAMLLGLVSAIFFYVAGRLGG